MPEGIALIDYAVTIVARDVDAAQMQLRRVTVWIGEHGLVLANSKRDCASHEKAYR